MAGKGSKQRPLSVPTDKFAENWDRIFNKPKQGDSNDSNNKERKD